MKGDRRYLGTHWYLAYLNISGLAAVTVTGEKL